MSSHRTWDSVDLERSRNFSENTFDAHLVNDSAITLDWNISALELQGFHKSSKDALSVDVEETAVSDTHLLNNFVNTFHWQDISVVVKDNKTGQPKPILDSVHGFVEAGRSSPSSQAS